MHESVCTCMCVCVEVTDRRASPQGALRGAIDKDSLGKFLSLVLRHSSVIQPCQVTVCHETKKKKRLINKEISIKKNLKSLPLLPLFGYVTSKQKNK